MSNNAEFRIFGNDLLRRRLKGLSRLATKRVAQRSISKGGTVLLRAIRKETPVKTGALKRSFGRKAFVRPEVGEASIIIGVRQRWRDKKSKKIPNFYAKKVNEKNPFVKRGLSTATSEIIRTVTEEAKKQVIELAHVV
jgi:hypothetical protein